MARNYEEEKEKKRKNRMDKIQAYLTEVLEKVSPGAANQYEIVYKPVSEYYHDIFRKKFKVDWSESPTYEIELVSKSNPQKAYRIMILHRQDVDHQVKNKDIKQHYMIPSFSKNVEKGLEYLRTNTSETHSKNTGRRHKKGGLERTLSIISILSILISLVFLSSNLTAFTVLNLTKNSSNFVGVILFLIGLSCVFLYFKKAKKSKTRGLSLLPKKLFLIQIYHNHSPDYK